MLAVFRLVLSTFSVICQSLSCLVVQAYPVSEYFGFCESITCLLENELPHSSRTDEKLIQAKKVRQKLLLLIISDAARSANYEVRLWWDSSDVYQLWSIIFD